LDGHNNYIKWTFFKDLVQLQGKSGLHAATKLRREHINYSKNIMKVRLAIQTFSNSMAGANDYCPNILKLPQFRESQYTSKFCRIINDVFDILNVRNALSKQACKKPLSLTNQQFVSNIFNKARQLIFDLKTPSGCLMLESRRKTGFIGLLVNMASTEGIMNYHIRDKKQLKYFLSYKVSQAHLEMFFFFDIPSRGGFTNNPTAIQLQSAYKKLLIDTELKSSAAENYLAQDDDDEHFKN
jgi:hypothetical protein